MSRNEIKQTIDDFLSLVEKGCGSAEENVMKLKLLLDKLALAQHFATYEFDEKDYAEMPKEMSAHLGNVVTVQFPNLGCYNLAGSVTQNVGEGKTTIGWALDDIAGIAEDLLEAKWCWENNSAEDGLWHFKFSFDSHWSHHLRGLQVYLLNLEQGT